ncbi:MAG: hypothetical protein HFE66_06075 [Clostridiales bacterium]|jgi:hypothetical protein|nr:hypothetical protein [Clostridiales bacterium]
MKKCGFLFFLCVWLALTACSASVKDLYGTWYVDTDNVRNIIQFYETDTAKNAFIWAVYDIAADERTSVDTGTYELKNKTITFTYSSGVVVTLDYTQSDDTLTFVMDGAVVEFQLFELGDTTA